MSVEKTGMTLKRTVVMIGMMGSGKTAIGRALSERLGVAFLDSDAEIEAAAQAEIAEIFTRDGEPFFRKREAEVIKRLLSGPPVILSTGGGAYLAPETRAAINNDAVAVWLDADIGTLWDRVRHKTTRPLLMTDNPRRTLGEIFEKRVPIYRNAALHVTVSKRYSIDQTTQAVIDVLAQNPDILEIS